jgi:hypothetical protein
MCNSLDNGLTFAFSHFYQLSGWDVYILSVHHNKNAGVCLYCEILCGAGCALHGSM